jgi:hypothetical protein
MNPDRVIIRGFEHLVKPVEKPVEKLIKFSTTLWKNLWKNPERVCEDFIQVLDKSVRRRLR